MARAMPLRFGLVMRFDFFAAALAMIGRSNRLIPGQSPDESRCVRFLELGGKIFATEL